MRQSNLWNGSCRSDIIPISKGDRPDNSASMQPYPVAFASNRFSKQRTLIIGSDRDTKVLIGIEARRIGLIG